MKPDLNEKVQMNLIERGRRTDPFLDFNLILQAQSPLHSSQYHLQLENNFMKKVFFIIFLFVLGSIVFEGCDFHKLTEPEARIRAQADFEYQCKAIIHYETNEFDGPNFTGVTKSNTGERWYSYVWTNKSVNLEIVVGVSESGNVEGSASAIDHTKPTPPLPKKNK